MIHYATVYMNKRNVTPWVSSLDIVQPRQCIYRHFDITFSGWSAIEQFQAGAVWDIFESHDEADPRSEIIIRAGIVPPDRERSIVIDRGTVPAITLRGYDNVWLAQRRRPRDTIVMVPGRGFGDGSVQEALEKFDAPIGRYRVWSYTKTIARAVRRLAQEAGLNIDNRMPNVDLKPFVVPPEKSYWEAIVDLVRPWRPETYFRRADNLVVFVDPEAPRYGIGRTLNLSKDNLVKVDALPVIRQRINRVILRIE